MRTLTVVWKSYLVLWIVVRSFSLGTRLLFGAGPQSAAFLALGIAGFIPIIGFIVEKPVLEPRVWRAWLFFLLGWMLFDRTFYSAWFFQPPLDHELFGVLLAVPGFAATYIYSGRQFRAWAVDCVG